MRGDKFCTAKQKQETWQDIASVSETSEWHDAIDSNRESSAACLTNIPQSFSGYDLKPSARHIVAKAYLHKPFLTDIPIPITEYLKAQMEKVSGSETLFVSQVVPWHAGPPKQKRGFGSLGFINVLKLSQTRLPDCLAAR